LSSTSKDINLQTIAFYNLENLFDIYNDERTNDDEFLPTSAKRWTEKRYQKKIYKLGSVISKIGFEDSLKPPALVGLGEVENDTVLNDLIQTEDLIGFNYGFVHYDSKDERGIDVALLYDRDQFVVEASETYSIYLETPEGERDFTRDILLVSGILDGDPIHVIVNHWPSRHEGDNETSYKRMIAAKKVLEIISQVLEKHEFPRIIVIGDFNDNPNNESIQFLTANSNLFNATESLWSRNRGTENHDFQWNLFDQIFISKNLLMPDSDGYSFERADIFDDKFVTQFRGKFKGQPFRTYVGKKYMGGYSDHFPIFIQLKKPVK